MDGSIEQLLTVDRSTVSRDELLDHVAAVQTAISRFHAELERDLAALAHPSSDLDDKCYDREEIACLLRWSSGYTQSRVAQAHQLVDQLPKTLSALGAGALAPEHARAVADASYGLETKLCGKLEDRILDKAATQTVTEFKRSLTRAVKAIDPHGYAERHQRAVRHRDVSMGLQPDGMTTIWSIHTAADADAIMTALQTHADRQRGDGRLVGERRADALRDLILGSTQPLPSPRPATKRRIPDRALSTATHLRHDGGWHVRRRKDGTTEWTSPSKRKYYKPPPEPNDEPP